MENIESFTGNIWTKCKTGTFLRKDHSLTFDRVTVRLSLPSFPFLPSSHQLPPQAHYFPALLFQKDSALVWRRLWWLQEKAEGENGPDWSGSSAGNSLSGHRNNGLFIQLTSGRDVKLLQSIGLHCPSASPSRQKPLLNYLLQLQNSCFLASVKR